MVPARKLVTEALKHTIGAVTSGVFDAKWAILGEAGATWPVSDGGIKTVVVAISSLCRP
jgi:hypothetical protein